MKPGETMTSRATGPRGQCLSLAVGGAGLGYAPSWSTYKVQGFVLGTSPMSSINPHHFLGDNLEI